MKKIFLISSIFLVTILINSCTIHKGQIVDLNYGQPVSILNQAVGISSAGYFLGFGGNKSSVLLKEAKDDLIRNRPLQPNEKYVNQNLNISTTYILFYTKTKFTITADIISNEDNYSYDKKSSIEMHRNELFNLGDSLISKSQKFKGVFIAKMEDSLIKIKNRKQVTELLYSNKVYRSNGTYKEFKIGEEITFKGKFSGSGKIKGFGLNNVIAIDEDGFIYIVSYKDINKPNNG